MRALLGGSALLGLALVMPAGDALPPLRGQGEPATPKAQAPIDAPGSPLARATGQRSAIASTPDGVPAAVDAASQANAAVPAGPAASPGGLAVRASSPGSAHEAGDPVSKVRQFTPGSKAHAEAIASVVASAEAQRTVAPVARLYFAYFGRAPDYEGLSHYVDERDAGTPLGDIAEEFAGSDEFGLRYGTLDDAAFVDLVYRNVAGGPADAAQRAHWIAQLESGAMTRGEVMLAFSEGAGFRVRVGDEVFVTMAYAETLRRSPQPAELARWVGLLEAGHPRRAVIDALIAASRRR